MESRSKQPTYKRQRFLLDFICQLQDGVTATDLQKLIFVYVMSENAGYYKFVPYKFGPYSFQLAEDVEILRRDGFLKKQNMRICTVENREQKKTFLITDERGDKLISKVYREYPYYAINSEIIDRLFSGTEAAWLKNEKGNYRQKDQMLFTIGYEGKTIEEFVNELIQNDVRLVCDVRKNPLSRKFGFSKEKFKHIIETVGIHYVHIPELGIESEKRVNLETIKDYNDLFRDYEKTLPKRSRYLEQVYSLLCENIRIALMCFEKDSEMCHRHVIRDYLFSVHEISGMNL